MICLSGFELNSRWVPLLSVVETAKKLEKSECWMANDHGGIKVLKARNEGEDQNSRIKQLISFKGG